MSKLQPLLYCVLLVFLGACSNSPYELDDQVQAVIINGERSSTSTQLVEDQQTLYKDLSNYEQEIHPYIDWWQEFAPFTLNQYSRLTAHNLKMAIDWTYLYVPLPYGELYALDTETGDKIWNKKFTNAISAGVTIYKGQAYVGLVKGNIIALDSISGKELWRRQLNSSVAAISPQSDSVYVRDIESNIYKINAADGSEIWHEQDFIPKLTIVGSALPLETGDYIVYGDDAGSVVFRKSIDASLIKRIAIGKPRGYSELDGILDIQTEFIKDGVFYAASWKSQMAAIDLKTQSLLWLKKESPLRSIHAHGDILLVQKDDGSIEGLLPQNGETIWRTPRFKSFSTSAMVKHKDWWIISDNDGTMLWFDGATGKTVAHFKDEVPWSIQAASIEDQVFVLNQLGQLIKIKIPL